MAATEPTTESPVTVGVDANHLESVAAFTVVDGEELVVYDRREDRAWIQTAAYVSLEQHR